MTTPTQGGTVLVDNRGSAWRIRPETQDCYAVLERRENGVWSEAMILHGNRLAVFRELFAAPLTAQERPVK